MIELKFQEISTNEYDEGREIVFPHDNKWFKMAWADVPEKFKELYWVQLALENAEIPPDLDYISVTVTDGSIELDLAKAEEFEEA